MRLYGNTEDLGDTIWGFSYKINYIKQLLKPQFQYNDMDVDADAFVAEHSHMLVQFDMSQLPSDVVIKEVSSGKVSTRATDVIGHCLVFDRFKHNLAVTSLLQTADGNCPCVVINNAGKVKGLLMRRLIPLRQHHIEHLQGLSVKDKSMVYSHVWKFASGLLLPITHGRCLQHVDIRALSGGEFMSGNMVYDPSSNKIIVVDYDSVTIADSSVDDMNTCLSLYRNFATTIQLDMGNPSILDPTQTDLFLHLSCLSSAISIIRLFSLDENGLYVTVDKRWYQVLSLMAENISMESGCIDGNPIFEKSSVKTLEIFVDDTVLRRIDVRLMKNCRMVAITLFLYLKVFIDIARSRSLAQAQAQARASGISGRLSFHCFPRAGKISIRFQNHEKLYAKADAVIELLLSSMDS